MIDASFVVVVLVMVIDLWLIVEPVKRLGVVNILVGLVTIIVGVGLFGSLLALGSAYMWLDIVMIFFGVFCMFRADGIGGGF